MKMKLARIGLSCVAMRFACLTAALIGHGATSLHAADTQEERDRKIYYFEHRVLPQWTHGSNGAFYYDLANGHTEQLIKTATELLGAEFAAAIRVRPLTECAAVLITFPEPTKVPHCYFAAVAKTKEDFRYFTAEKTFDLEGLKAVLAEWAPGDTHVPLGYSKENSEEWFVHRVTDLASKPKPKLPSATPPAEKK